MFGPGSIPGTSFGAAWNIAENQQEYLIQASDCTNGNAVVTYGSNKPTQFIYRQSFVWSGQQWQSVTLTSPNAILADNWFPQTATGRIATTSNPAFVIGYVCQYVQNTWKCGCKDATCAQPFWQLQGVSSSVPDPVGQDDLPVAGDWKLEFNDEFDNPISLDPVCGSQGTTGTWATYWCAWNTRRLYDNSDDGVKMHDDWKGIDAPAAAKTIKQVLTEAGWQNPSLHEVSNGTLKMRTYPIPAAHQTQFDWYGAKPPSAASMISTERSFGQTYGYWEVRAKLNSTPKNNHFSLWMLPVRPAWPPEIDLLETVIDINNQGAGILSSANSHGESPAQDITFFKPDAGMLDVWHTYGFHWTETEMTWYVDGKVVRSHPNFVNEPMYFLGSWEVGGNWVGDIDANTPWPQEMEIDYVRVYSKQ